MKHLLAYMISAYIEPKSLYTLVNALDMDGVDFYVHIDKKAEIEPFYQLLKERKNVFFTKHRAKVSWGGWSQIEMQEALINEVLDSPFEYKKVVNLTGMDFPVASNQQLISTLSSDAKEFIIGYRLVTDQTECKNKILYYYDYDHGKYVQHFFAAIRIILKLKRFRDYSSIGYDFYFGSEYWALSYNVFGRVDE